MEFVKNSILKLTIFLSCALLISCYIDYNPVEHDENLKIEIKEESNSNIDLEDEGGPIILASYVEYDTIYSLSDRATDIIRGEVLNYRVENVDVSIPIHLLPDYFFGTDLGLIPPEFQHIIDEPEPFYEIFTIYSIKVLDVYKGGIDKYEVINFARRGGKHEGVRLITHNENPLTIGDDLILFMLAPIGEGRPFFRLNPSQSVYRFVEPDPSSLERGIEIEFENISERGSLTLTLTDLMNIAEANFPTDNPEDDEATPKITREKLALAIQEAEERIQTTYTQISWARLLNLLRDARNVYNNLEATQLEIDDVTNNLRLAIETLEELPPEPEPIDRTELIAAIQEAEARVQATYTPISWARLQNPLRDARNIRDNANATQEQIVSTTEILIGALNGLVSR